METDPARMVEMLVGLPDVDVLGIEEDRCALTIHVQCRPSKPGCPECGAVAHLKDRRVVTFVDLPCFGKSTTLAWHKARCTCPEAECPTGSFTETDERIATSRLTLTDRAGRFATLEVGRYGRSVNEVAEVLGCDWHAVNDAVHAYGAALVDHPDRFADVTALGLDEVQFVREGPYHRQSFSTSIVDVGRGQLLDVVPGRSAARPVAWRLQQGNEWLDGIEVATLDLSGTYRSVFDETVPALSSSTARRPVATAGWPHSAQTASVIVVSATTRRPASSSSTESACTLGMPSGASKISSSLCLCTPRFHHGGRRRYYRVTSAPEPPRDPKSHIMRLRSLTVTSKCRQGPLIGVLVPTPPLAGPIRCRRFSRSRGSNIAICLSRRTVAGHLRLPGQTGSSGFRGV